MNTRLTPDLRRNNSIRSYLRKGGSENDAFRLGCRRLGPVRVLLDGDAIGSSGRLDLFQSSPLPPWGSLCQARARLHRVRIRFRSRSPTTSQLSQVPQEASSTGSRPRLGIETMLPSRHGRFCNSGPEMVLAAVRALFWAVTHSPSFSYPANSVVFIGLSGGFTVPANGFFWAGITFDNNGGTSGATAAQLNEFGQQLVSPPTIGSSQDVYFQSSMGGVIPGSNPAGGLHSFGGNPPADFGWQFFALHPFQSRRR